jgi:hypothetical protein
MKKLIFGCVVGVMAISAAAEASEGRGPWHLTVGPAWRARVKMETSGSVATPSIAASSSTTDYDKNLDNGWSASDVTGKKSDPDGVGGDLWAIGASYTETTVTAGGGDAAMGATDVERPLGVKAKFGYDVWANELFAVALDLRFAGYWNMRSTSSGRSGSATKTTRTVTDYWLFKGGPFPDDSDFEFAPDPELDSRSREYGEPTTTAIGGAAVRSRLTADLYQIGIGPSVTWHAFSWLDAYAGVAALCNIASLDFEAGSRSSSETQCRVGVAAEVGLVGYLTDNLGIYGEVGYEWIDGFDASVGGLNADVDFSSLVVSAGLVFAF